MSKVLKATAIGPSNIAFTKYWGQLNHSLVLANNDSISMTLSACVAVTTVHFSAEYETDRVTLGFMDGEDIDVKGSKRDRVVAQLDRFREMAGVDFRARVLSHTSFPDGVGIASSAAGFSALTLAVSEALGFKFDKKELSIQTRLAGSGSACRSVYGGFVRWRSGKTSETSYAEQIAPSDYWDLRDIVVLVSEEEKKVSSLGGHERAPTSPYYKERLRLMPGCNDKVQKAIKTKDMEKLGAITEEDAVSLQMMAMTSKPPIFYWNWKSMRLMNAVRKWREEGVPCYFTFDAGPSPHIICEAKYEKKLLEKLKSLEIASSFLVNSPGEGARVTLNHLF